MTRTAWFHCFSGTAGDMTMAALVDAGADPDYVAETLAGLGLEGFSLTFEPVQRCGLSGTLALVLVSHELRLHDHSHDDHDHGHAHDGGHDHGAHDHGHGHDHGGHHDHGHDHDHPAKGDAGDGHTHDHRHAKPHTHRPYVMIRQLLDTAELPPRVRERAQRTFHALAEVEADMHGVSVEQVEFHEVGSTDAIVDIVGACAAMESLGIDRIVCSPIAIGMGMIHGAAHGDLPNPAPASAALLARRGAPGRGLNERREIATPTGVALMTALADTFGPMPALTIKATGHGAGRVDIQGRPNVVQVVVGTELDPDHANDGQPMVELAANVDDTTGEIIAHTISSLLDAGANDAWATPIVMKKGRPAHTLHVLCEASRVPTLRQMLIEEAGSLGVRATPVDRWAEPRHEETVTVDGFPIRVKVSGMRRKAEFDDASSAAAALGVPVREVLRRAEAEPGSPR